MIRPLLSLVSIAAIFGLAISTLHALTRDKISENQKYFESKKLQDVIGNNHEAIIELTPRVYYTRKEDALTGFIFEQSTRQGYNGLIRFWVAIDNDQKIRGVRVIQHQETPGIGDKIETNVSDWIYQFDGLSLSGNGRKLKKDGGQIDQFSGATITSRAMVNAVNHSLEFAELNITQWRSDLKSESVYAPKPEATLE